MLVCSRTARFKSRSTSQTNNNCKSKSFRESKLPSNSTKAHTPKALLDSNLAVFDVIKFILKIKGFFPLSPVLSHRVKAEV